MLDHDVRLQTRPCHEASASRLQSDIWVDGHGVDGRIDVDVDISSALSKQLSRLTCAAPETSSYDPGEARSEDSFSLKLNVLIQVVGSRGDVQPFIALAKELQRYGHRVRLATHVDFESFIRDSDVEFFPIGGDPKELMAYMVKNPGLFPHVKTLREGEISRKRKMIADMLDGLWRSCIEPDPLTGDPFVADAIIANPPSFAHVHCAEALSVPLHIMFTMPWTKTRAFPHPLANLSTRSNTDKGLLNYLSFGMVEIMTWQGMGDLINSWRRETLGLEAIPATEAPFLLESLKIPVAYCWSPALVPKPEDWLPHIDICGFFTRDAPSYIPAKETTDFLNDGPEPIYIGFGSIMVDDPAAMTATLLDAVRMAGVRAIISRGWSRLGGRVEPDVLYLDDCPHEWLFQRVKAVIHHGGAGTTACGLQCGRPTVIVPFFGDQPFWGEMVAAANAGPKPIPHRSLTAQNLAEAIRYCLTAGARSAAQLLSEKMRSESGVRAAVNAFHKHLSIDMMPCDLFPDRPAAWLGSRGKHTIKLSKVAQACLSSNKMLSTMSLSPCRQRPVHVRHRRWDPVTAVAATLVGITGATAVASIELVSKPCKEYLRSDSSSNAEAERSLGFSQHLKTNTLSMEMPPAVGPAGSPHEASRGGRRQALAIVQASALSMGKVCTVLFKGAVVDVPVAITDGLLAISQSYSVDAFQYMPVEDCKSGLVAAGKTFSYGVRAGFTDIFIETCNGKKNEGTVGAIKGLSKGTLSLATKSTAGVFSLVAYPMQGAYRSVRKAVRDEASKSILRARINEGAWLVEIDGIKLDPILAAEKLQSFFKS